MITSVRLQQFRIFDDASFEFAPGVNVIIGKNATGKTSILEGINLAARGRSFSGRDATLVQNGQEWLRVDLQTDSEQRVVKITPDAPSPKSFEIGSDAFKRFPRKRALPVVVFEPSDVLMLYGSPDKRRVYVDDRLETINPDFYTIRRDYTRILAQRNALLKEQRRRNKDDFFVWDVRLSDVGGRYFVARQELLQTINQRLPQAYKSIANTTDTVQLVYGHAHVTQDQYSASMLSELQNSLDQQLARGFTLCGPHREDIDVHRAKNQSMVDVASRGEKRSVVLALKAIELELVQRAADAVPLLLLDDVFGELDAQRRSALTNLVKNHQTIITTTDADVLEHDFTQGVHSLYLG